MSGPLKSLQFGRAARTPVVFQGEAAECGIACLAMLMGHYGNPIDLPSLRRRYAISLKGMTLQGLVEVADRAGFSTRAVRLDLEDLSGLRLPCILHWDMSHFVVLVRVRGDKVTIHDPALGRRVLPLAAVSKSFTGVALELFPNERFHRADERQTLRLRDLFRRTIGLRGALGGLFALSLGLEAIALVMPMVSQIIIDEVVVTSDRELLYTVTLGLALLLVLQMVIGTVRQWAVIVLGTRVGLEWNASLFDHLTRLPFDYFSRRHVGDILSRFGALSAIQRTLTTDLVQAIMDGMMAVGMLVMLFIYGGWLGAVAVVATALDLCLRLFTYRVYRQASEEQVVVDARQQSHFMETVRGMASIKLLGLRQRRRAGWLNLIVDSINIRLRLQRFDLIYGRIGDLIFGADRLIMLAFGASLVMKGHMSVGMLVAFLSYKDQFAGRIGSLIGSAFNLRMLGVQTDRLSDIVMTEPEPGLEAPLPSSLPAARPGSAAEGAPAPVALSAQGISARYGTQDPLIFSDLSLDIPAGASVAIVGASGCGKTTLLKTLMGLMRPDAGTIAVDGVPLDRLGLEDYRSRISGVLQDDGLFSGSLAENICGFSDAPDEDWMRECAARAAIADDIARMPMGYETLVGDMGSSLSGGQKQRVILARALYRRPAVIFLDEATSHLDELTERKVADALRATQVTRVIVAHRPATIAHADLIYVFQPDGRLTLHTPPAKQPVPTYWA